MKRAVILSALILLARFLCARGRAGDGFATRREFAARSRPVLWCAGSARREQFEDGRKYGRGAAEAGDARTHRGLGSFGSPMAPASAARLPRTSRFTNAARTTASGRARTAATENSGSEKDWRDGQAVGLALISWKIKVDRGLRRRQPQVLVGISHRQHGLEPRRDPAERHAALRAKGGLMKCPLHVCVEMELREVKAPAWLALANGRGRR